MDRFMLINANSQIGITKEIADKWCAARNNENEHTRYGRTASLRQFSQYLRNLGFNSYIPQLPKFPNNTFVPYIYSHDEIKAVFNACDGLRLRRRTTESSLLIMPCLLRMLYATGIRITEALSLKNKDIDFDGKCLMIRDSKNNKDRLVPITDTLVNVCKQYLQNRINLPVSDLDKPDSPFFVSPLGLPVRALSVRGWFEKILAGTGITGNKRRPRLHDLRHSFACHSFVKLADDGLDLYCSWPYLSTYLGHQSLSMTEQYVRLTEQLYPELLKDTAGLYVNILHEDEEKQKGGL
ncbi:tyrosine-type recombinase/integrase [Sphingobacterium sp. UME9]|uniref:tyrosine-type recombinase/integrase n=1 Tax=Sphingobacterium sp. UME9 TaxID=1862316 RepID=UPI001601ED09|nr:tyrosine-type recombinase/integrase [Sphingobacterium sp. UME9]